MELRHHRERDFHDKVLAEGTRHRVHRFYKVARRSRGFYDGFLESRCPGKNVLDYGCGTGRSSFLLQQRGATVTGIDICDTAIKKARERAEENRVERITFRVLNAEQLDFQSDSFDLVCGNAILHHLDVARAFSELARALKPDGIGLFLEPLGHNPMINLYRRLTPDLRTQDEHPLLMRDLRKANAYFGKIETHFFHLLSLGLVPFREFPGFGLLLKVLDRADRALFRMFPSVCRYAWTVVIVLSQPNKG